MEKPAQTIASSTIDPEEIERFSRIADEWWDPHGKFKPLHRINPVRIGYILEQVKGVRGQGSGKPLAGLSLLDIGCGGGLISEPMCRLGARVTGIDASEKNIAVAKLHAEREGLAIDYRATSAEALHTEGTLYDIVLALEIIEHVADIPAFVATCSRLVRPGGLIIWSTMNRTAKSYALAIVGAEYVLRWLPRGTHDWKKFVRPSELCRYLRHNGAEVTHMTGMRLNQLNFKWELAPNHLGVNYLLTARRMES